MGQNQSEPYDITLCKIGHWVNCHSSNSFSGHHFNMSNNVHSV